MYKILSVISDEDRDKGISLTSILATYKTILEIEGYEINKIKLKEKIIKSQNELTSFWNYISEKYMFPLYLDKTMKINYDNSTVYIED